MRRQHIRLIIHVVAFLGFVFLIGGTISCSQQGGSGGNNSSQSSSGC